MISRVAKADSVNDDTDEMPEEVGVGDSECSCAACSGMLADTGRLHIGVLTDAECSQYERVDLIGDEGGYNTLAER